MKTKTLLKNVNRSQKEILVNISVHSSGVYDIFILLKFSNLKYDFLSSKGQSFFIISLFQSFGILIKNTFTNKLIEKKVTIK